MFNEQPSSEQKAPEATTIPEAAGTEEGSTQPEASASPETDAAEAEKKYNELQDQFTRLAADFENYRKRMRDEMDAMTQRGYQQAVMELLPVIDNLERANASLNEGSDPKTLYQSFTIMQKQLANALERMGVSKIPAVGQPFNPEYHEAISRMESAEVPENTIMYEAQGGYMLNERVIRPAQVAVSAGSPDAAAAERQETAETGKPNNPFRT